MFYTVLKHVFPTSYNNIVRKGSTNTFILLQVRNKSLEVFRPTWGSGNQHSLQ